MTNRRFHLWREMLLVFVPLVGLVGLPACAEVGYHSPDGAKPAASDLGVDLFKADGPVVDSYIGPSIDFSRTKVFAHTEDSLFQVDPQTLAITRISAFEWPPNTDIFKMTDIALSKAGEMIGVSKTTIYSIDPKTAKCTRLAKFSIDEYHFVGLSFVIDPSAIDKGEYLMGLDKEGLVYEIDPKTGNVKKRGELGETLKTGGDVVSVKDFGTVATVELQSDDTNWLAKIDPGTGKATLIGDTGIAKVWGLGFWGGQVFGFAAGGEFALIDVKTGKGTLQTTHGEAWWGAGVFTEAPTIY